MLRKIFNVLVVLPLAILFVVFAVANRHLVTLSFDPFNSSDPALAVTLPLFVVIIVVAMVGVLAGGIATWFGQRHWRRAARLHEADARHARTEMVALRERQSAQSELQRPVPALAPGPQYAAFGRDKRGATL
ncbi:MAG TPA: DUF1049 domain-containing protein [Afipia sp.]